MTEARPRFDQSGPVQSVDFDCPEFSDPEARAEIEALNPLVVISGLLRWAGRSRSRLAVIGLLLGQDRRSQGEIAREIIASKQSVSRAVREGRDELARLTHRGR